MFVFGILILFVLLGVVPLTIGCLPASYVDKKNSSIAFMWVSGLLLMWAGFQFICVPLILTEGVGESHFVYVTICYTLYLLCFALGGGVVYWRRIRKSSHVKRFVLDAYSRRDKLLWGVALVLITMQVILSVVLVYADGDDAYYVAVSTLTESSGTMYKVSPYSMGPQELDERHSLAPFPIWIAYLSRMSGVEAAIVAHSVVAPLLIALTYVVYYLIGKELFKGKKEALPIFLGFIALYVLFGDYSSYTAENFMLARSRQGKAALGNIVIPILFYLLLLLLKRIQDGKKVEWMLYVMLMAVVTVACLCTSLGSFLSCLLIAVIGIIGAVTFRFYGLLWKLALCCSPAVLSAVLYFVVG